jgi:hypothetical protein
MVTKRRIGMTRNIFLVVAGLLVGLLGFEGLFRLYEHCFLSASYRPAGSVVDLQALNYNDSSVAKEKTAKEFRILAFGDSFCHGIVKYPASYHGVARDILTRAVPDRVFRLVNFGEPSASFYQYLKSMANWTDQVAGDAVVVNVFLGNDITDVALGHVPDDTAINRVLDSNFVEVQTGRKRLCAVPHVFGFRMLDYAYAYAMTWREGHYVLRDIPEPYTFALGPMGEKEYFRAVRLHLLAGEPRQCAVLARGWRALADLVRGLKLLGRTKGVKAAIMLSPAEAMVSDALWRQTVAREGLDPKNFDRNLPDALARRIIAEAAPDIPVLDLTPVFRCAAERGDTDYYPRETHWNVEGNRLAGEALARFAAITWLGADAKSFSELDPCLTAWAAPASVPSVAPCLEAVAAGHEP